MVGHPPEEPLDDVFRFGPTEIPGGWWSAFEDPSGNLTYVLDQSTEGAGG